MPGLLIADSQLIQVTRRFRLRRTASACVVVLGLLMSVSVWTEAQAQADPGLLFRQADSHFRNGRIREAVAAFDALAAAVPDEAPQLWQRGIALYYAARYADCRAQFESHRTVNPNDVENAAWHFLCVARAESPAAARAALLPVGPDRRSPMREVYGMLAGTVTPAQVLAAGAGDPSGTFYAELYVGLYFEALGDTVRSRSHLTAAASPQYAVAGGYMHRVAQVHVQLKGTR